MRFSLIAERYSQSLTYTDCIFQKSGKRKASIVSWLSYVIDC
jgi:hypothetical protein